MASARAMGRLPTAMPMLLFAAALGAGCSVETRSQQSPETGPSSNSPRLSYLASQEAVALHDFIRDWSLAAVPDDDATYARFVDALADDFVLIGPDGSRSNKAQIVDGFRGAYGRWRDLDGATLEVRNVTVRSADGAIAVVDYEEWHLLPDGAGNARRSTVVFRWTGDAPGDVEWLHLHETAMEQGGE